MISGGAGPVWESEQSAEIKGIQPQFLYGLYQNATSDVWFHRDVVAACALSVTTGQCVGNA
eukprot:1942214-Rhodomonas_salina.4